MRVEAHPADAARASCLRIHRLRPQWGLGVHQHCGTVFQSGLELLLDLNIQF